MARKSIRSWRRGNSPNPTPLSRPFAQKRDCVTPAGSSPNPSALKCPTSNFEARTLNLERGAVRPVQSSRFDVQRSRFSSKETSNAQLPTPNPQRSASCPLERWAVEVECWALTPCVDRRVMGAWWPPRSSKPSSVCFAGRGMFDSYPLRQSESPIVNPERRCRLCPANRFSS